MTAIKNFLGRHRTLRNAVRWFRWQLKKIPVLRNISIAIDTRYFATAGMERPDTEHAEFDWEYFESYAKPLVVSARGRVLELGCGHGFVSERLAQSDAVTGVVAIDKISDFLKQHPKIEYRTLDLRSQDDLPHGFDTIVTSEFIEHVSEEDFITLLPKVVSALNPGGSFIGSTPRNPTPYKTFSGSRFHVREYSERDLLDILERYFGSVTVTAISEYCLVWSAEDPFSKN